MVPGVPREGFPRACRLVGAGEYRNVFRSKLRSVDPCFLVLASRNGRGYARLGLAVSKRNLRTNVSRNRVKRLIRESFRKHRQKLSGLDVVVVSQKRTATADNAGLFQSLHRHWETISK